ncbi:hypothetical protein CHS0354_012246 [Potamilus streckersoni]|uniref:C2H2-type domain-containing protein n=1 Tax=Potamilus streckersoni TaxID=2493646 RepID=A0AAE0SA40_9BIVA|nr:hypothetical protein CHS0354_012246 [Potamilus streckersoni]
MQEKPPVSNKMFVLVNHDDFKLLFSSKKVPSLKLKRIDADEKFSRSECSCVPQRTIHDCVLCEICGYLFINEFIFRKHFIHQSFHHLQSFKCERCDRLFQTEHLLKRHQVNLKIHAGWRCKPYQCHVCSSRFSQTKFLKNHLSLNRKCILKCAICGQDFLKKKMLKRHIIDNHIIPKIKTEDDYSVIQDFGILQGNTVTFSSHQNTIPDYINWSFGEDISIIKIEPLVTDTKRTKDNIACQTDSTISPTMEQPKPFDSMDVEDVVSPMGYGGVYVSRDDYLAIHNTSQSTTGAISSLPIQYCHAATPQLIAEKHFFQMKNTCNPFSSNLTVAVTNGLVHSQHQQAALLESSTKEEFLPRKDTSKSQDTLTVSADSQVIQYKSADSQVIQYKSQQSVFPDSFSGQSLVQNSHRLLSDLLKKPPLIATSSPPAQNQSQQFLLQQVNTERGSPPLKRTPQSVTSMDSDQVMHYFLQVPQDQAGEEKLCVLPPKLIDQQSHNAYENCSTGAAGQIYNLTKNTSENNLPEETEDQSLLVTSMPSGSQVVIQNKICNITPCCVYRKKFISNLWSDQHMVNIFQCTKCKRMFSKEEVLTHKCDKMDVSIASYSIKNKMTVQPNELAVVSEATGKSDKLLKTSPDVLAQQSVHEATKNWPLSKDATSISDQCCQSCRSIIVNFHKPETQPTVHLVDDHSQLQRIQNLSGNAISLLFESGSSFDQNPSSCAAADLQAQLKTIIDSSHRNTTMLQVPECLQQKTLDSSHERDSLKNVLACLRQTVIEKIRNNISCLIDQSYKENNSIQSEQSFPADCTKYSDQVKVKQEDESVWNDAPMEITSDRNQTFLVGMACNMTDTSGNRGEDSFQEKKNAQIISTQIKEEDIDPAEEQRSNGGHTGTSTSDQVSEMGEGLLHQVEEVAERPIWTNPIQLIKVEEFAITNFQKQIEISEERPAKIDSLESMDRLEKPKLISLLGGMESSCEGAVWTDSSGQIKVFSQNCNEVETDSDTITVSNPDIKFHFIESQEMDVCTVDDEFIIESEFVESTSVLPEGFVYVENL